MIKKCDQGDIFEVGNNGNFQFIFVLAPHGMALQAPWNRFRKKHLTLTEIEYPYEQLSEPKEFIDGKWIQFAENNEGLHGMDDAQLEKVFDKAFAWAGNKGLTKIITTGVRDVPFNLPDALRVAFIKDVCSRDDYSHLEVTLISRDESYLGYERNSMDNLIARITFHKLLNAKVSDEEIGS